MRRQFGPLMRFPSFSIRSAWRNGHWIGYVVREGRRWFPAAPDGFGTFLRYPDGRRRAYRTRAGAMLAISMFAEGISFGDES